MEASTKERLTNRTIWMRALYMLLFALVYSIAETVLVFVAIFQLILVLITGGVNEALQRFGGNLSAYCYGIFRFQTFNTEALSFPFADWPDVEPDESSWNDYDDDYDDEEIRDPAERPVEVEENLIDQGGAEDQVEQDTSGDASDDDNQEKPPRSP